jgi:hypothetical protein
MMVGGARFEERGNRTEDNKIGELRIQGLGNSGISYRGIAELRTKDKLNGN